MREALADAGLAPPRSSTSTPTAVRPPLNDRTETLAIRQVFGAHADRVPVSGTKGMHGHALGATRRVGSGRLRAQPGPRLAAARASTSTTPTPSATCPSSPARAWSGVSTPSSAIRSASAASTSASSSGGVDAMSQTILVTGATGYVGGRLVPRLLAAGYRVRCLTRDPARLAGRPWPGVEIVPGDMFQPATLGPALAGVDVAYYLVHSMAEGEAGSRSATGSPPRTSPPPRKTRGSGGSSTWAGWDARICRPISRAARRSGTCCAKAASP